MNTLPADVRSAKITRTRTSLNASTTRAIDMAGLHLRTGEDRAGKTRQQRAIEAVIASDRQERLLVRHPANDCLLAKEC